MAGIREAVGSRVKNFVCSALSAGEAAGGWLGDVSRGGSIGGGIVEQISQAGSAALACDPDTGGGASGGAGVGASFGDGEGTPPGQCPGVPYRIEGVAELLNSNDAVFRTLGYVTVRTGPLPRFNLTATANNILVEDDEGTILANLGNRPSGVARLRWRNGYPTITRNDGSAGEQCDLAGEPDNRPKADDTITYDGPDGPVEDEPVTIIGDPPIIGPGGGLFFPVEVCFAAFCLDVNFNLSTGDIDFNFGGEPGASACCPQVEPVIDPVQPTEDDPPDVDDPLPIAGVMVVATSISSNVHATEYGNTDGPSLFVPRLGVIRFAIQVGGIAGWTADYPLKQRKQWVAAPEGVVTYDWDVIEESGVLIDVTPVYTRE